MYTQNFRSFCLSEGRKIFVFSLFLLQVTEIVFYMIFYSKQEMKSAVNHKL